MEYLQYNTSSYQVVNKLAHSFLSDLYVSRSGEDFLLKATQPGLKVHFPSLWCLRILVILNFLHVMSLGDVSHQAVLVSSPSSSVNEEISTGAESLERLLKQLDSLAVKNTFFKVGK